MMSEYRFDENAAISGSLAAEGMILLENHDALLPLKHGTRIALFGDGQMKFSMCGMGSGSVLTAYRIDFIQGLLEAEKEGKIHLDHEVLENYRNPTSAAPQNGADCLAETAGTDSSSAPEERSAFPDESPEFISDAAGRNDVAVFVISRNAGEGHDRYDAAGDYRLSESENALLRTLIDSAFEKILVVVNSGGLIDLSWFARSEKLKGLLLTWQPGMQGGRALAKILCGEVNPSGRLTDTIAKSYSDYPSAGTFRNHNFEMVYEEDIFVGYRYFETIPGAGDKVLYPFGYGLSYTTFSIENQSFRHDGKLIRCTVEVTNTGKLPGREVVQLYSSRSAGGLEYPARELRAFAKTRLLAPGESQSVEMQFDFHDLAAFDDTGVSGAPKGSFVLEKGVFTFHVGTHIRNTRCIGRYELAETVILSSPGLLLQNGLPRRLHADGSWETAPYSATSAEEELPWEEERVKPAKPILLDEVASGRYSLEQFISQLSRRELLHLSHGQDAFTTGATGGIGNLRRYGVPNPQTADGPAGVRRQVPSTGFPCGTLLASTWDTELQYRMGEILGNEAAALKVDILLAPALNIHRDPLCGRNFEYFSEDPLLSGCTAANIVTGIQSQNVGATIKHFAVNNREDRRKFTDCVVSERALREIYLRGFEIAVRTGHPWCVMSSYNLVNGRKCSCNYNLLCRILRDEWGFDGLVMTDWVTHAHLWQEILAGNDVKMPGRELDIHKQTDYMDRDFRLIPRRVLERNAANILRVIMKTNRFRDKDFGRFYLLKANTAVCLPAAEMSSVMIGSSNISRCDGPEGGWFHSHLLTIGHGNYSQRLTFNLDAEAAGRYQASFRLAADRPGSSLELCLDNVRVGELKIMPTAPRRSPEEEKADSASARLQSWQTQGEIQFEIPKGKSELGIFFHTAPDNATGINLKHIVLTPVM